MSNAHPRRARRITRSATAIAVIAATIVVPASTASAQLGGLVKRARDKVVENQVEKQVEKRTGGSSRAEAPPKFDDVTVELTAERIDGIVRGLAAGRAILDGSNGSPGRDALNARREQVGNKSAEINDKNAKAFGAWSEKFYEVERCRNNAMRTSSDKRSEANAAKNKEMQAKLMADPALQQKYVEIGQKMAVAQQRGDTVELRRLAAELGIREESTKPDSIAADKACGPLPEKPPLMVEMQRLDKEANALGEQVRQLEESAASTEQKKSGLNERQYQVARERIEAYLSALKYKAEPGGFTPGEREALGARRADLEKYL